MTAPQGYNWAGGSREKDECEEARRLRKKVLRSGGRGRDAEPTPPREGRARRPGTQLRILVEETNEGERRAMSWEGIVQIIMTYVKAHCDYT